MHADCQKTIDIASILCVVVWCTVDALVSFVAGSSSRRLKGNDQRLNIAVLVFECKAMVSPGGTAVIRTKKREIEVGGDDYWAEVYGDANDGDSDED